MCLAEKSYTVTSTSLSLAEIVENYDYYDYGEEEIPVTVPKEAIEGPEAHAHSRRDLVNEVNVDEMVTYRICVRLVTDSHIFTFCHETISSAGKNSQILINESLVLCVVIAWTGISPEWPLLTSHF